MADFQLITEGEIRSFGISNRTLEGVVRSLGVGVSREMSVFKNNDAVEYVRTFSDSDGTFSIPVIAGDNDFFRITVHGLSEGVNQENASVFHRIVAL